jgi:uncharacterized protein (TIGR00299 family) protein
MSKIAYFECKSGAAGDMLMAALLDAGGDLAGLRTVIASLDPRLELLTERVEKRGIAATQVQIRLAGGDIHPDPGLLGEGPGGAPEHAERHAHHHEHRSLAGVLAILDGATASETVKARARGVFQRLAQAEADVHGKTLDTVHFHEVGALDAIADVLGVCWLLDQLNISEVHCSALATGAGTVKCAHGLLPVPVPAVSRMLSGIPVADVGEDGELLTPTGAALLVELADAFGPRPALIQESLGFGAGRRDTAILPNLVRVVIGTAGKQIAYAEWVSEHLMVMEANVDDQSPEQIAWAVEQLFDAGALDAWQTPIQMKKGRMGAVVSALLKSGTQDAATRVFFRELSTLGIRVRPVQRLSLPRDLIEVEVEGHKINVKVARLDGEIVHCAPEHDHCATVSEKTGLSLREVVQRAKEAARA